MNGFATIKRSRRALSVFAAATLPLTACSVEDIAGVATAAGGRGDPGQVTVWTSDSSPSPIEVMIDGRVVGTLTAYRSSAPACGAATTAGAVTVTLPAGAYSISARETHDSGMWPATNLVVSAGGCSTFALNP